MCDSNKMNLEICESLGKHIPQKYIDAIETLSDIRVYIYNSIVKYGRCIVMGAMDNVTFGLLVRKLVDDIESIHTPDHIVQILRKKHTDAYKSMMTYSGNVISQAISQFIVLDVYMCVFYLIEHCIKIGYYMHWDTLLESIRQNESPKSYSVILYMKKNYEKIKSKF